MIYLRFRFLAVVVLCGRIRWKRNLFYIRGKSKEEHKTKLCIARGAAKRGENEKKKLIYSFTFGQPRAADFGGSLLFSFG